MDEFPQEDGMECEDNIHDWEATPGWGVIIGVSKCSKCGKVAKEKDFNIEVYEKIHYPMMNDFRHVPSCSENEKHE